MAITPTITIDGLTRAAIAYSNVLRILPAYQLNQICKKLKLNMIQVQNEDIAINKRRIAGIVRPYKNNVETGNSQKLIDFFETKLKPELIYAEIVDDINAYRPKHMLSNLGEWVDNKTKKHPAEAEILRDIVLSFSEDIAFQLFHAERDESILSPSTAFDGFFTGIDIYIADGKISKGNHNLYETGTFVEPTTENDYSPYLKLVDFVKSAHPLLRERNPILYAAENPLDQALAAYKYKVKGFNDPTMTDMLNRLRSDAKCPNLEVITDTVLGTGDRLMMMQPGLLDIGVNSVTDSSFVQVRNPFPNPNQVQFWVQSAFGTRLSDVHEKVFHTNEQKNTALNLAGDYR